MTRVRLKQVGDNLYEVYCLEHPEYAQRVTDVRHVNDMFNENVTPGFYLCWYVGKGNRTTLAFKSEEDRVFIFEEGTMLTNYTWGKHATGMLMKNGKGETLRVTEEFLINRLFPREQ